MVTLFFQIIKNKYMAKRLTFKKNLMRRVSSA